jgi:hypothetical protein
MKPAMEPVMRMRPSPRAHFAANFLDQVERAGDVGVHDAPDQREVLIQKSLAEPAADIGE